MSLTYLSQRVVLSSILKFYDIYICDDSYRIITHKNVKCFKTHQKNAHNPQNAACVNLAIFDKTVTRHFNLKAFHFIFITIAI